MNGKRDTDGHLVWDDLRIFLAISREGTLSGAAKRLRLGLATVSRRMERLEASVGQPLFVRQQTGYRLTEDGTAMVERAEEMEATARSLTSGMAEKPEVSGRVRLATAENLATGLLLPKLPDFRAKYPRLTIDLVTDIATVNLHRRDADLALRMVKPDRGHVSLQSLGTLGYGLYASDSYLAQRASNADAAKFEADDFITWGEAQAHLPAAQWMESRLQGRAPVLSTSSVATQLAACRAGVGFAILPHFLARREGLICLDGELGIDQTIWLVTQSDLIRSRRIQVVAEFCRSIVRQHRDALATA
ncbi:transcriptional regulator, LysR family [Cohaesibacter sp. ES.047]|uniref:LysR family transcriptional regulator n=1 Tax=Cohaesibacter sp. ES.047 TaxID=1798205 RepID=UPI000BBF4986|nr:LysR family transcriptional regulator [Cohaesibacter sp. ES.047]SNY93592.1 transcriptional regulator, LysR family [Cohaesibacter sp. ES.047]